MSGASEASWSKALERLKAGESKTADEARRLHVDIRTVQRRWKEWKAAAPRSTAAAPAADPPPQSPPPGSPPVVADAANGDVSTLPEPLRLALDAAGPKAPDADPAAAQGKTERQLSPAEDAKKKDGDLCVETIEEMKGLLVVLCCVPMGVSLFHPALGSASELSGPTENAIRRASGRLAPVINKYQEEIGLGSVVLALLAEGIFTAWELAPVVRVERAKKAAAKKKAEREKAETEEQAKK